MRDDFAVFILTHGRAGNISTLKPLYEGNYTGKLYFLIDDEDEQADDYRRLYGDENVIVFEKQKVFETTDTMDITGERKAILFARRAVFGVAKSLGLRYFLMLEDDFNAFEYRWIDGKKLMCRDCKNLDAIFEGMITFLEDSGALSVALAQGGDFIGGANSGNFQRRIWRKAMNTFFCRVDRPIDFRGTMNEDVTAYTTLGSRGELFLTVANANIRQKATQSTEGGMTDLYVREGTYQKSFYSVMSMPSAVRVSVMGARHKRIHHSVDWDSCVPKILGERWRKNASDQRE